jgi:hypothetical protein
MNIQGFGLFGCTVVSLFRVLNTDGGPDFNVNH